MSKEAPTLEQWLTMSLAHDITVCVVVILGYAALMWLIWTRRA